MNTLHVTAHKQDASKAFNEAAKFSTGAVWYCMERIKWAEGDSVYFRAITCLEDAYRLAGLSFDLIIFDTTIKDEKIKDYLQSLVRSP